MASEVRGIPWRRDEVDDRLRDAGYSSLRHYLDHCHIKDVLPFRWLELWLDTKTGRQFNVKVKPLGAA